jgi:superfamily II DNA/RNA helicase
VVVAYEPTHAFADFPIDARLKDNITKKGYVTPSAIQDQSIPVILEGKDIVGIANTGTGKTGAFLIPLLHKVIKKRDERVLIMVPTRELAIQIEDEYRGFAAHMGLRSVSVVGGANIHSQIRLLRQRPQFVIGTPGRIKDLIERQALDLSGFKTVVLDEADRMLDMGFIHDMRHILSFMPEKRHTLFFSATLSSDIEKLIHDFLTDPVRISVKTGDTSKNVDQDVVHIGNRNKFDVLSELLSQKGFDKVLVFGRTKHGVEKLAKLLTTHRIPAASIHGNKTQGQRQRALREFKENRVRVLIATDVAARGLDIPKVSHVINYDVPSTYEDYVHRIGRTGRAGERGQALTFIEDTR